MADRKQKEWEIIFGATQVPRTIRTQTYVSAKVIEGDRADEENRN